MWITEELERVKSENGNICFYCKRTLNENEPKFISIFYPEHYVCVSCADYEDKLYIIKNKNFPDFTNELEEFQNFLFLEAK